MKIFNWFSRNIIMIAAVSIGGLAGFLYYHYIGCSGGSCPITSHPVPSILYGAFLGGLISNHFSQK